MTARRGGTRREGSLDKSNRGEVATCTDGDTLHQLTIARLQLQRPPGWTAPSPPPLPPPAPLSPPPPPREDFTARWRAQTCPDLQEMQRILCDYLPRAIYLLCLSNQHAFSVCLSYTDSGFFRFGCFRIRGQSFIRFFTSTVNSTNNSTKKRNALRKREEFFSMLSDLRSSR